MRVAVRLVKSVLALNCGSSSLKFQLLQVAPTGQVAARPARGGLSGFGPEARVSLETADGPSERSTESVPDHRTAAERVLGWIAERRLPVDAVAHRVVHGGPRYAASALIDDRLLDGLDALGHLAPLHNRPSIDVIRAARASLGETVPMVVVFDTAFHAGLPDVAREYAIPRSLARRHGIRRYGFHGTSFRGVVDDYARLTGQPASTVRIVALHLGSGCSAAAIADGRSIDTSMGFTPLEGLVMGTRAGDLDPAIVSYLTRVESVSAEEVESWLNERSGLAGLGGSSNMRALLERERTDPAAALAVDSFCYRARKYVGAYLAVLGWADALVFTGAIGEGAPEVRRRICAPLQWLGVALDPNRNAAATGVAACLSPPGCRLSVWIIPADEERVMAADTVALLAGTLPR